MRVWTSVKALPPHKRGGTKEEGGAQAGVVTNDDNAAGGEVEVKWDVDGMIETVPLSELQALN